VPREPQCEARETPERFGHAERGRGRRKDVGPSAVQLDAGILEIHRGHSRDAHGRGARAGLTAREPVPAGVERGSRDEDVRPLSAERAFDLDTESVEVRRRAVVAADQRRDDASGVAKLLLKTDAGPDRAFAYREREVARLLAANAPEELIQILDDTNLAQVFTPSSLVR
jgi:hypothetical protein